MYLNFVLITESWSSFNLDQILINLIYIYNINYNINK